MNIKKLTASAFAVAASTALTAAVPQISNVTMAQDTTRQVTITYTLADAPAVVTVDVQTNNANGAWASIGGEAVWNATGDVWKKVETGSRTITWRPDHSWPDHKIADGGARAVVTAWALDNTPDYMVVDLAAAQTVRYYPAVDFLPGSELGQTGAITNNPAYKTTQLVMRKIMARGVEWTMGSADGEPGRNATIEAAHRVTLANNYYIGVFEITQAQWKNIATSSTLSANFTEDGKMRPMEKVSWNNINNNFLGLLNNKTGLDFTLPSEAQWEFAARAGHGSGYWNNGSPIEIDGEKDDNLALLARYKHNLGGLDSTPTLAPSEGGTAFVGTYLPNSWGLYDMHGNVWEWCLDLYAANITTLNGAVNTSGSTRVLRGGCWNNLADVCRPANRWNLNPNTQYQYCGFRVLCTAGLQ